MNAGDLRKLLADPSIPDDAELLEDGSDHSHRETEIQKGTALYDAKSRSWTEDFGEKSTPEKVYGKRLVALLIGN